MPLREIVNLHLGGRAVFAISHSLAVKNVPVIKVDGAAPVVFNVPTEGREGHSNVAPWDLHPVNISLDEAQDRAVERNETKQC